MNNILGWLKGGDLRSDGLANEAAAFVLAHPEVAGDLLAGLEDEDPVVRGRAGDALEKVARERPNLLRPHFSAIEAHALDSPVAMVRWHMAMICSHLAIYEELARPLERLLLRLLDDDSTITRSWAISSLAVLGRLFPERREAAMAALEAQQGSVKVSLRARVRKALEVLRAERRPFPKGWIKSACVQERLDSLPTRDRG